MASTVSSVPEDATITTEQEASPAFKSRSEALIENLREYRSHLVSELNRVEAILAAADPLGTVPITEHIAAVLNDEPSKRWSAYDVMDAIVARGWATDSEDPVNTVRAGLARVVAAGKARRVRRGRFAGVLR